MSQLTFWTGTDEGTAADKDYYRIAMASEQTPGSLSSGSATLAEEEPQIVYLTSASLQNLAYNGPVQLSGISVANPGFASYEVNALAVKLNDLYSGRVVFVTARPAAGDFSTIYLGAVTGLSTDFGSFRDLVEAVDAGNANRSDNGFVNLTNGVSVTENEWLVTIAAVTDRLIGEAAVDGNEITDYSVGGSLTVATGETFEDETIGYAYYYADVTVYGSAHRISLENGGTLIVQTGGNASDLTVNSGAQVRVAGATANTVTGVTVNAGGALILSGGAGAQQGTFVIKTGGRLNLVSGTSIAGVSLEAGASLAVRTTCTVSDSTNSQGSFFISGGVATNLILEGEDAYFFVAPGHSAVNTIARDGAQITSYQVDLASRTASFDGLQLGAGAVLWLTTDAVISNGLNLSDNSSFSIAGKTATNLHLHDLEQYTSLTYRGFYVLNGGTAEVSKIYAYGLQTVQSGGTARNTVIYNSGVQLVERNGATYNTIIEAGGVERLNSQYYYDYATAYNTTVKANAMQQVASGYGRVSGTVVLERGELRIDGGAVVIDADIRYGGYFTVNAATTLQGVINLAGRLTMAASVTIGDGATLNLDLVGRESGFTFEKINDMSFLNTTGTGRISLSISGSQVLSDQIFYLAEEIGSFNDSITLIVDSEAKGTLSLGGVLLDEASGKAYYLRTVNSYLVFIISANLDNIPIGDEGAVPELTIAAGVSGSNNKVTVNGILHVYGNSSNTSVQTGGREIIYAGGVAADSLVSGLNAVQEIAGGTVSGTTVNNNGTLLLTAGSARNINLDSNGTIHITGGRVDGLRVGMGGTLRLEQGIVTDFQGSAAVSAIITSTAAGVTLSGTLTAQNFSLIDQVATNFTLVNGGILTVTADGSAVNTTLIRNGTMYLYGDADGVVVGLGKLHIYAGGSARNIELYSGELSLDDGAVVDGIEMGYYSQGGNMRLSTDVTLRNGSFSGMEETFSILNGQAVNIRLYNGGILTVKNGGSSTGTVLYGAMEFVESGSTATGTVLHSPTGLSTLTVQGVNTGGTAIDTVINYGNQKISGGAAVRTIVNATGLQEIYYGTASYTQVNSEGALLVAGGTVSNVTVASGATMTVRNGSVENGTINGSVYQSGGLADSIVFDAENTAIYQVSGNSRLTNITVSGIMSMLTGGSISIGGDWTIADGTLRLAYQAGVTVEAGTTFNFDISGGIADPRKEVLLANWSSLTNGSEAGYSITVSSDQAAATYSLASDAYQFKNQVTLKTAAGVLGEFSWQEGVGYNQIYVGNTCYSLTNNQTLRLKVSSYEEIEVPAGGESLYLGDHPGNGNNTDGFYARLDGSQTYAGAIFGGSASGSTSTANWLLDGAELDRNSPLYGGTDTVGRSVLTTSIRMLSGVIGSYGFAGGYNTNVTTANTELLGGTVHNYIGAGRAAAGHTAAATNVNLLLDGLVYQSSNSMIFGGGYASGSEAVSQVTGKVTIEAKSGSIAYLSGGGHAQSGGSVTVNQVLMRISGGVFDGYVYGGGRATGAGSASSVATVSLTITGGTFNNYVIGGGYGNGGDATVGTVELTITGGTFAKTVFGGGQHNPGTGNTGCGTVTDDITVTIDLTSGGPVNFTNGAGITAAGTNQTACTAHTSLTLAGDGSLLQSNGGKFTGWLNGSGGVVDDSKTHTLRFENFTDSDFRAQINGFNRFYLAGSTAIVHSRTTRLADGMDYTFDLTGRTAVSTAMWTQRSGSLGLTADSFFTVNLSLSDLGTENSGSYLLLAGPKNSSFTLEDNWLELNFRINDTEVFSDTWLAGTWNNIGSYGYDFRLNFEAATGNLSLEWEKVGGLDPLGTMAFSQFDPAGWYQQDNRLANLAIV